MAFQLAPKRSATATNTRAAFNVPIYGTLVARDMNYLKPQLAPPNQVLKYLQSLVQSRISVG